jgi:hypothetical protein
MKTGKVREANSRTPEYWPEPISWIGKRPARHVATWCASSSLRETLSTTARSAHGRTAYWASVAHARYSLGHILMTERHARWTTTSSVDSTPG